MEMILWNELPPELSAAAIKAAAFQQVTAEEGDILARQGGNDCTDWSRVLIAAQGTDRAKIILSRIKRCSFHGTVYLACNDDGVSHTTGSGREETLVGMHGLMVPPGLYDTAFYGFCYLSQTCHVSKTTAMNNVYVGLHCVIMGCGVISSQGTACISTLHIHVGPETGGRQLVTMAGMHYADICDQLFASPLPEVAVASEVQRQRPALTWGSNATLTIVGPRTYLTQCDKILNCMLAPYSVVSGSSMDHCMLLSSSTSPVVVSSGAKLSHCILNEACTASNGCVAEYVFMCEQSALGDMARVVQSVIGPDSSVAGGGECHHSLLGPFVGFHHQSLLIAAVWPLGRGNVAYGAKVGANHTGRVNDQECWPGEGVFFGLGSLVKFPCNLLESPYSIVAPGTILSPQKLQYPFSLITAGTEGSVDRSAIKPAWILYGNPYIIDR